MTNPMLLLTVGLPGSGKSTWARNTGYPVVNPDSIRLALHGQKFYGAAEPMVWAVAHLMVAALFKAGHMVVVLDATNISKRRRQEWRSQDWQCGYVCFKTDIEECKRRVIERDDAELVSVIDRMARDIEWPQDDPTMLAVGSRFSPTYLPLHFVPVDDIR